MSSSNCCFLICIQVSQETGKVVWYSHLFKNFPQFAVVHTVKGFSVVNEAEVDVVLELLCFLYDPTDTGSLISGSSAFSKSSLYIWKFLVHVLLKPSLKDLGHYCASMWNEHNCMVIWTFFGIALLWEWNDIWIHFYIICMHFFNPRGYKRNKTNWPVNLLIHYLVLTNQFLLITTQRKMKAVSRKYAVKWQAKVKYIIKHVKLNELHLHVKRHNLKNSI